VVLYTAREPQGTSRYRRWFCANRNSNINIDTIQYQHHPQLHNRLSPPRCNIKAAAVPTATF